MQIILTKNVEKLGKKGDVKVVKNGYYMNFLAPRGLAKAATPKLLVWAEKLQEARVKEKEQIISQAQDIKKSLEDMNLVIEAKVTKKDTLYGKINEKNIIEALEDQAKIKIEKKQIDLPEPIKNIGKHEVKVQLTDDVDAMLKIEVKALKDEK